MAEIKLSLLSGGQAADYYTWDAEEPTGFGIRRSGFKGRCADFGQGTLYL